MELSEELLHYLWQYRLYNQKELKTKSNKPLIVQSPGRLNKDAGPDFEHSRLIIDGTTWAGNVELHLKSSHWNKHQHQHDAAYNNVILHVVYEHDAEISLQDGTVPETLALKPLVSIHLLETYRSMMISKSWVPCEQQLATVDNFMLSTWLERVLIERLEERTHMVNRLLEEFTYNWEEVVYVLLARSFGFKVNAQPFESLARSIPYKLMLKYKANAQLIESLVFGQAGILQAETFKDVYPNRLKEHYTYLKHQYNLKSLDVSMWKFLRMRPFNFPTMRLAQFAAWCSQRGQLFSKILSIDCIEDYRRLFLELPVHDYWCTHYRFDKRTKVHSNSLGINAIDGLILNTVVTILFSYGKYIGKEMYIYRAIKLLRQLPHEKNQIIERFRNLGVVVKAAAESQALLQLKTRYCDRYRCLDCGIGLQVFKQNKTL